MSAAAATLGHAWKVSTSVSGSIAWATPRALYDALDREFGFTLDAAAAADTAKHVRYFDKDTDALRQSWAGEVVFCNPPFGRDLGDWVEKARAEAQDGGATIVMLLPARTGTRWFHRAVLPFAEIRFLQGRVNYVLGGNGNTRAPFDSMVVVFRPTGMLVPPRAQLWLGLDLRGGRTV